MEKLYVLYDTRCGLCRRCRVWLSQQPAFVPLVFMPLDSLEVSCRFPGIEQLQPDREIVVISDEGDVWQGGSAWVMCLWALRAYREWSQTLAQPALLPLARRACAFVSAHRYQLSKWLFGGSTSVEEFERKLEHVPVPVCGPGDTCRIP